MVKRQIRNYSERGKYKLKTEITSQEKNVVEAKAQFTPEEVAKAVENTYKKVAKSANIKGFRKGHIPRKTLELYFPKSYIYAETLEEIIPDAIDKMIEEYELKIIAEPDVKPEELKEGEPYEITVKFEVTPDFDLPSLDQIEVEKTVFETTDAIIDEQIERILESRAQLEPTYEDRPVTKEDYVSVKYDTTVTHEDGSEKKAEEGQKTEIFLGSETMRPEVVAAIEGKVPGDTVSVEFPAEGDEAKKDKAVKSRYDIELLGIMKQTKPELTDEFVAELTQSRQKTVAEFREVVKKQLEAGEEKRSIEVLRDRVSDAAADMTDFEIPQRLIDNQKAAIKKQQAERLQRDGKMTIEEYLEKTGMDKDSYENEVETAARKIVKRSLVLSAIADANDIEWTPEELEQEVTSIARMSGVDPKKLKDYVYGDRERLFDMAERIRSRKTVDFLLKTVKVNEVKKLEEETKAEEKPAE